MAHIFSLAALLRSLPGLIGRDQAEGLEHWFKDCRPLNEQFTE
ncbi:MAG: hypothetical protein ACI9F9_002052 [Candidatus Paceibacteria bacterium]|jgi:hypothetical protein